MVWKPIFFFSEKNMGFPWEHDGNIMGYYGMFHWNILGMIKGSLVRKLPNYERLSWLACSPWWQPHHHASSWEVWEIGNTWIQAWKRTRMRNPVFFRVKAAVVAEGGSLFPRFRGSIGTSVFTKWNLEQQQQQQQEQQQQQQQQPRGVRGKRGTSMNKLVFSSCFLGFSSLFLVSFGFSSIS